jgi:hypothetical protein
LRGRTVDANGRRKRTTTRAVNGIDGNVKLNRALWTLTEKMAELSGQGNRSLAANKGNGARCNFHLRSPRLEITATSK